MFLLAIFSYVLLLVGLAGATLGGARLAARWLRVPDFRWFDSRPAQAALWRRFGVRLVSALASLCLCSALFWGSFFFSGESEPTTTVLVHAGPARLAGMRDGDRVVSVDGVAIETWDALRKSLKPGTEQRFEIERAGVKRVLRITPNAAGRIAVTTVDRQVYLGPVASAERAVAHPFIIIATVLRGMIAEQNDPPELVGPVSIVHQASKMPDWGPRALLWFMASIGSYYLPFLLALQLFDALTLPLFLKTHPQASESGRWLWRLARLQQALLIALGSLLLIVPLAALHELGVLGAFGVPVILLLMPAALAIVPLVWIAATHFWGAGRAVAIVVPGTVVPCVTPIAAIALLLRARRELREHGFQLGLFVAARASEP